MDVIAGIRQLCLFALIQLAILDSPINCMAMDQQRSDQVDDNLSQLSYQNLLKIKHAEQLRAAKSIASVGDYAKQYKMLTTLYEKMFEIVSHAKLVIERSGYVHGEDFPPNITVRDALSTTVENSLFFGNILLRLPDITHKILATRKEWRLTLQWSWQLCNELSILDHQMRTVLDLAGQELGFVEKAPDYFNPFKAENQQHKIRSDTVDKQASSESVAAKRRNKKNAKRKGPQMSSANYGDL